MCETPPPCVVVNPTGMEVRVKVSDSRSNSSRDIRLPHFVANTPANDGHHIRVNLKAFCLKTETAFD